MDTTPRIRPAVLMATLLILAMPLGGCGRSDLERSEQTLQQAWKAVETNDAKRLAAVPPALDAIRQTPGFDRDAFNAAARAFQNASRQPPQAALNKDEMAFDRYKQAQGELTAALFRMLGAAQAVPELRENPALIALFRALTSEQAAAESSRKAYSDAVAEYNALVEHYPTKLTAMLFGYEERSDFVRRAPTGS